MNKSVSSHRLNSRSRSSLVRQLKTISHKWEAIALHLDISNEDIKKIEKECRAICDDCLREVLSKWLNKAKNTSWNAVCNVLKWADEDVLSEEVKSLHLCGCILCTGRDPEQEKASLVILSEFYEQIYRDLTVDDVLELAKKMVTEDVFSKDDINQIKSATCTSNEFETMFTQLESAVSDDDYNLKKFAACLNSLPNGKHIEKEMLKKYHQKGLQKYSYSTKEVIVDEKYEEEFHTIRRKLGTLCIETLQLLKGKVDFERVKSEISLIHPEYKKNLNECSTIDDVIQNVIRPEVSVAEIHILKDIYHMFNLPVAPLQTYSKEIESFKEKMRLKHAYGQMLIEELHGCHIPKFNSIVFVLDWDGNEYSLKDLEKLFKSIVKKERRNMKVTVIYEGNSIVVECYVNCHDKISQIVKEIKEKEHSQLVSMKVIRIMAAGRVIFSRQDEDTDSEVSDNHHDGIQLVLPSVIKHINQTLKKYPDGAQILKELIQNADDAEATEVRFILDSTSHSEDEGGLIHKNLSKFQGPALYAWNNSVFKDKDWKNFGKIADSVKQHDSLQIGKFGMGFLSVFHLTDLPIVISSDSAAILDPLETFTQQDMRGWKNSLQNFLSYHGHSSYFTSLHPSCMPPQNAKVYPATLFRFPLRSAPSDISSTLYSPKNVMKFLFSSFMLEAPLILLFLKNVEEISLYDGTRLLYKVSILSSYKETLRSERQALVRLAKQQDPSSVTLRCFSACLRVEDYVHKDFSKHHWLMLHAIGTKDEEMVQLSQKLETVPWVGVAAPLPYMTDLHGIEISDAKMDDLPPVLSKIRQTRIKENIFKLPEAFKECAYDLNGRVFCFLPLPLVFNLPINIHGCFSVSESRRTIEWPSSDSKSETALWNEKLMLHHIGPLYSILICCRSMLVVYDEGNDACPYKPSHVNDAISDPYSIWPVYREGIENEMVWKKLVKTTIASCIQSQSAIFWSTSKKWVRLKEALFLPHDVSFPEIVFKILHEKGLHVVVLPQKIRETLLECGFKDNMNEVSHAMVREVLKTTQPVFSSFEEFEPLLECALTNLPSSIEKAFHELKGLQIIPVAEKAEFTLLTMNAADKQIHLIPKDMEKMLLFPGLEKSLIHPLNSMCYHVFRKLAKAEKLKHIPLTRIKMVDSDDFGNLLNQSIQTWSKQKARTTTEWNITSPDSPPFKWILDVWEWLKKNNSKLNTVVGIPILPKQKIDENGESCSLLPIPSANQKYYIANEEEPELTLMLEKMGATIFVKNEFIFIEGRLKNSLMPASVSQSLEYLIEQGKHLTQCCDKLSYDEKERFLLFLAQYFSSKKKIEQKYKEILCKLPIIPIGVGSTPMQFTSLEEKVVILNDFEPMIFKGDLQYPSEILKVENSDIHKLLKTISKQQHVMKKDELLLLIFNFAVKTMRTSEKNSNDLIAWIFKSHELSPKLKDQIKTIKFVKTKADRLNLKSPSQLYDSDNSIFSKLLDDTKFPASYYKERGLLGTLKQLGLNTWDTFMNKPTEELRTFVRQQAEFVKKSQQSHERLQRSICLLELISNIKDDEIMSSVKSIKFVFCQECRPKGFPKFLPWYGEQQQEGRILSPDQVCYDNKETANIVGCVLPIIHENYRKELKQLPDKITRGFLAPNVEQVLQQLNLLIDAVDNHSFDPNEVSKVVQDIYSFLDSYPKSFLLPEKWLWWNDNGTYCFLPSKRFMLSNNIYLSPFIYCIMSDKDNVIHQYNNLLKQSGIKDIPSCEDLVEVLTTLSKVVGRLSEDHVSMVVTILNHLMKNKYTSTDILMPTIDNVLLPVSDCTYDDREWIKQSANLAHVNFVHKSVSVELAHFLNVKSLSIHVAPSKELSLSYMRIGQKEKLTSRLKEIVNDYCGKIDVFKELIQNADDARATEVKFVMDWRTHGTQSLFTDEMRHWQGPALVSYNNSTFTDQDFKHICELAGGSKKSDILKIGQYGLGFCSCYILTDVPSFISRRKLTIFDPHTRYLGERVSIENPGMQIDLFEEKEGVAIYADQFAPYDGLFGCNLSQLDSKGFEGTIFRFPLRMKGHSKDSDISHKHYDEKKMKKKLTKLQNECKKLLIFLKHVCSLELYEIKKDAAFEKLELVFKVHKSAEISRTEMIHARKDFSQCVHCNITFSDLHSMEMQRYLISSAIVNDIRNKKKGTIPFAEVAVQVDNDKCQIIPILKGQFFCFLPLHGSQSHCLPFHINSYFDVTKDRQSLKIFEEDNWNKIILEKVLSKAFVCLLRTLTKEMHLKEQSAKQKQESLLRYYSLWPPEIKNEQALENQTSINELLIASLVKEVFEKFPELPFYWSENNGGLWVPLREMYLFENPPDFPNGIKTSTTEIFSSSKYAIVECPEHVSKIATNAHCKKINYCLFIKRVFLPQIEKLDKTQRNLHLKFLLQSTSYLQELVPVLQSVKCIPTTISGSLVYPTDLIDTRQTLVSGLYTQSDNRFPDEEFSDVANALVILGMITDQLPVDQLVKRALTIKKLKFSDGKERMQKFLEYICFAEHNEVYSQNSSRSKRIEALSKIEFLCALPKPPHLHARIPWYSMNSQKPFFAPNQLCSRSVSKMVFTQCPLFLSPFEDNNKNNLIEQYLAITREVKLETVLNNMCCLIDSIKSMESSEIADSGTQTFVDEVFMESYKFLSEHCTDSKHKDLIQSKLGMSPCVWQKGQLSYPYQVIVDWKGKSYHPYLSCLSTETYKSYEKLFEALNVKKIPDFTFLMKILSTVKINTKGHPLDNEMLEFVVNIAEYTLKTEKPRTKFQAYLPDSKKILRLASKLSYKSKLTAVPDEEEKYSLHELIPLNVAKFLEVPSNQDVILEKNEDKKFLTNSVALRFGDFLEKFFLYSQSDLIFGEFIKLAESSNVTEVIFALDHQTDHPDQLLLLDDENWRHLQHSPALCVIFNKPLDSEYISNLCHLKETFLPGGNFNAVYHVTDCPSITSFDENHCPTQFCVFDPLRQYCCKPDGPPGRRWFGNDFLSEFSDQFKSFLIDKLNSFSLHQLFTGQGFTVFRLPLTPNSHIRKARLRSVNAIQQSFRNFIDSIESMLFFLKHLTSLSIYEINESEIFEHHLSVSLEKSKVSNGSITNIGSTYKVCSQVQLLHHDEEVLTSEWIVTESDKLPNVQSQEERVTISRAKSKNLYPNGSVAVSFKNAALNDSHLYCVLPTKVNSPVPVNMNGCFLIGGTQLEDFSQKWNDLILEHVLVPLYVEAILQAREFVNKEGREWYYSMFPKSLHNVLSIFSQNTTEMFYKTLMRQNYSVLLTDHCEGRQQGNWLKIKSGYFLPDNRSPDVEKALLLLQMPITCAPMFMFENLSKTDDVYATLKTCGLVTIEKLCVYLASLKVSDKESSVLLEYCIPLLEFVLSNIHHDNLLVSVLKNVPILPTLKGTLSKSGQLFESKFATLLPRHEEKFISTELEKSNLAQQLVERNIIVSLPISYVAKYIQLADVECGPQSLDSEQIKLVFNIWKFLENSITCDECLICSVFKNKPLVPSNKGFYPLSMSNQVFMPAHDRSDLMKKLGYPILEPAIGAGSRILSSLVANSNDPDDVIKCMQQLPPSKPEEDLTDSEVKTLLTIINSCTDVVPSNVVTSLQDFPIFQTIDQTVRHCVSKSKAIYVVPSDIPINGLVKLQETAQVLLFQESRIDMYTKLLSNVQYPGSIEFYIQLILPNFKCFTKEKELKYHLAMIKHWICDSDDEIDEAQNCQLLTLLKENWLIYVDKNLLFHVYELYDPGIEFHSVFHKNNLIPRTWINTDTWLEFLKKLGLNSKVAKEDWLQSANKVAEEGSQMHRATVNQLTKQSDVLLKTLYQTFIKPFSFNHEMDHDNDMEFLKHVAKIPFINNNKDTLSLRDMIAGFSNKSIRNVPLFIPFNESFLNSKGTSVLLLHQNVLPSLCDFLLDCNEDVRKALSVNTHWDDVLVENLLALSEYLCDTNKFVFSNESKRAIEKFKKLFEQYYELLCNSNSDQVKNLQGKQCILYMPNDLSFQLLQPSQVVIDLASDIDLAPFCLKLPSELQKYSKLWKRLKIKQEIDPYICLEILVHIKEEVFTQASQSGLKESDPYWVVTMNAYNHLIILLQHEKWSEVSDLKCRIVLPSDDGFLEENNKLVFNDTQVPGLQELLKKQKGSFPFKFICPPQTKFPPKALKVQNVSSITSEQLDKTAAFDRINKCTDQELYEINKRKHNCIMIEIISEKLKSDNLKNGLKRLYYNDHKKAPMEDRVFMGKVESLESMLPLLCKKNLYTVVNFRDKIIEGTRRKNSCYLLMERNGLQLLIAHPSYPDSYFWDQLAKVISDYLGISHGIPLSSILSCATTEIMEVLDNLGISTSYVAEIGKANEVGREIPLREMNNQTTEDRLIFCDYKEGEKVLYHNIFKGEPKCVVAKIQHCCLRNGIGLDENYVKLVVSGNNTVNASLLQVYKMLNASQRKNLSDETKSSCFCNPVIVAQLPHDQEDLLKWISDTFKYNHTKKCCSFVQLAIRILNHMYFSLIKSSQSQQEQQDLFFKAAELILRQAKKFSEKDSNAIIKCVQGFKLLKIDSKSPFALQEAKFPHPGDRSYQPHAPYYGEGYHYNPPHIDPPYESQPRQLTEVKPQVRPADQYIKYKLVPIESTIRGEPHPNQLAAKAWLQQAKADFLAASDISNAFSSDDLSTKYPALVCFLCHDVVEKSMKGIMYSKTGIPAHLSRTRNLSTLMEEMKDSRDIDSDLLSIIRSTVSFISVHGNKSRYPNYHYPPVSPATKYNSVEASESLKMVEEMMKALSKDKDFSELLGGMETIEEEDFKMASKLIMEKEEIPQFWEPHNDKDGDFKLVLLDDQKDIEEFQFVEGTFHATLPSTLYTIERVDRIQNKLIWSKYYDCAVRMMEFNKGEVNETALFHGTRETDPDQIYRGDAGFDMRFSKEGFWGRGNYFAVNASFSNEKYAYKRGERRQIIMAYVLLGYHTSIPCDRSLTKPPFMEENIGGINRRYDSVAGTTGGSKVFITYENDHAYPAYLITYTPLTLNYT